MKNGCKICLATLGLLLCADSPAQAQWLVGAGYSHRNSTYLSLYLV